jgi:beta-lactamase superfamily II metal-dependent hydrolase
LPDGTTLLIDGGATYETLDLGRAVLAPFLWDRGITHLDPVIGTHPQLDHIGGLAWTVQQFGVGRYWNNGMRREEAFYQATARPSSPPAGNGRSGGRGTADRRHRLVSRARAQSTGGFTDSDDDQSQEWERA